MLSSSIKTLKYWHEVYTKVNEIPELNASCSHSGEIAKIGGREEFTMIENKMINRICTIAIEDMKEAWRLNYPLDLDFVRSEGNPHFVGSIHGSETVAVVNDKKKIAEAQKSGAFVIRRPEDSQFGPDGCLYMIDYGETWGANPDSKLLKISYQRGNLVLRLRQCQWDAMGACGCRHVRTEPRHGL